jgi:hypothetical protein
MAERNAAGRAAIFWALTTVGIASALYRSPVQIDAA